MVFNLFTSKSRYCSASGALAALPATLPVIGTVVTLIGGTAWI
ncbi:hypothetical protein [Desulfallas sp. Bu1-1]|nr:hypothetical protein [Desulfallas sp. Bu1-1]